MDPGTVAGTVTVTLGAATGRGPRTLGEAECQRAPSAAGPGPAAASSSSCRWPGAVAAAAASESELGLWALVPVTGPFTGSARPIDGASLSHPPIERGRMVTEPAPSHSGWQWRSLAT